MSSCMPSSDRHNRSAISRPSRPDSSDATVPCGTTRSSPQCRATAGLPPGTRRRRDRTFPRPPARCWSTSRSRAGQVHVRVPQVNHTDPVGCAGTGAPFGARLSSDKVWTTGTRTMAGNQARRSIEVGVGFDRGVSMPASTPTGSAGGSPAPALRSDARTSSGLRYPRRRWCEDVHGAAKPGSEIGGRLRIRTSCSLTCSIWASSPRSGSTAMPIQMLSASSNVDERRSDLSSR